MHRTTILLPSELRRAAGSVAKRTGITLGELIRRELSSAVQKEKADREADPLFRPRKLMRRRGPADISVRHDDYLYGESSEFKRK